MRSGPRAIWNVGAITLASSRLPVFLMLVKPDLTISASMRGPPLGEGDECERIVSGPKGAIPPSKDDLANIDSSGGGSAACGIEMPGRLSIDGSDVVRYSMAPSLHATTTHPTILRLANCGYVVLNATTPNPHCEIGVSRARGAWGLGLACHWCALNSLLIRPLLWRVGALVQGTR